MDREEIQQKMEKFQELWQELSHTKNMVIKVDVCNPGGTACVVSMRYGSRNDADALKCAIWAEDKIVYN